MTSPQQFIQNTLPFLQKQVVYVAGAAELDVDIEQEVDSLTADLQDFDAVLHEILHDSRNFSQQATKSLYNKIYALLTLFRKVAKKLEDKNTSHHATFMVNFGNLIATLQRVRKHLLLQLEGDLAEAIGTASKNNLAKNLE